MNQTPDLVIAVIMGVLILTTCVFYEWIGELTAVVKSHDEQIREFLLENHTGTKSHTDSRDETGTGN